MLDIDIKKQLKQYFQLLENDIVIKVSIGDDKLSIDLQNFTNELVSLSPKIYLEQTRLERTPSFSINRLNEDTGIVFAGIPLGHEFNSLVLALLQVSGRAPKIEQELIDRIKQIDGKYDFVTYVSLTCQICPDVVQALNTISLLNPNITHTMVEGSAFKDEVENKNIMAVPTIYLNGEFFHSGHTSIDNILEKMGVNASKNLSNQAPFDVLVIGGGPAGASAAIYAARKGIRTGMIVERIGGQVLETLAIENLISVKHTEGHKLAANLEDHIREYDVNIMKSKRVKSIEKKDFIEVELEDGNLLKSKTVIIATGARWRNVNVPGEKQYKNKGVAYCPHCDGFLFKDKKVAVIGGGNSGIEAAIDLAGIATHVTVLEFMPDLKADKVLQDRLFSLPNITVIKNAQTKEITGTNNVNGITYIDRGSNVEEKIELDGVFVQIGLVPNTDWLNESIQRNRMGEIIVDTNGATNIPGIFAAGDCTNSPYKQIIISMGSGATAALSAFNYLIRN